MKCARAVRSSDVGTWGQISDVLRRSPLASRPRGHVSLFVPTSPCHGHYADISNPYRLAITRSFSRSVLATAYVP